MPVALSSPAVNAVIDRLREAGRVHDPMAKQLVAGGESRRRLSADERAELCRAAPLAVSGKTARLLYPLAAASAGGRVVEFGCSLGLSTVCLAAGLRDRGGGSITATELNGEKAVPGPRNCRLVRRGNGNQRNMSAMLRFERDGRATMSRERSRRPRPPGNPT